MSKENKLSEYQTRYEFWTSKAIDQFGYSINLFTTLSIAVLGYLLSKRETYPELYINLENKIAWDLLLYLVSILLLFVSVFCGSVGIISRLYDFRITRHIMLTRKRYLKRVKTNDGLLIGKIESTEKKSKFRVFIHTLRNGFLIVSDEDYDKPDEIPQKFEEMRINAKVLGEITWMMHRLQIIVFFIGSIIYGLKII